MPTKRSRSCLRFGRRKRLDPAPSRLVNTAYRKTSFHRDKPGRSSAVSSSDPICVVFARRTWSGYDQQRHNHARTAQTLPSALQAYPFFTMSIKPPDFGLAEPLSLRSLDFADLLRSAQSRSGGARRDRTDDLLLAKQALSQLSYGPVSTLRPKRIATFQASIFEQNSKLRPPREWWAWKDLNFRPHAYQARALTN